MADDKQVRSQTSRPTGPPANSAHAEGGARTAGSRTPLAGIAEAVGTPTAAAPLDAIDLRLLALLSADARVSQRSLARQLHMSPPAIGERIARLERSGVIRGYSVDIDWTALGYGTGVYLTVTADTDRGSILEALHAIPEVEGIAVVTGSMDLLARLRVRDHEHLRKVLFDRVWTIAGIERTETFLCLAEMPPKDFAGELLADIAATMQRAEDGRTDR